MNKLERNIYSGMTGCSITSRRSIRKHTTGAERASVKAWVKAVRLAEQSSGEEKAAVVKESAPVVAPAP